MTVPDKGLYWQGRSSCTRHSAPEKWPLSHLQCLTSDIALHIDNRQPGGQEHGGCGQFFCVRKAGSNILASASHPAAKTHTHGDIELQGRLRSEIELRVQKEKDMVLDES